MNKPLAVLTLTSLLSAPALAQTATPAAPASPHTFTANAGVVSDYLFRGISQTHGKPALQAGIDYSHTSGLYAGLWGSNIKWVKDAQDRSVPVELDLYAGYKNTFAGGDWNYDLGVITYNYPGSKNTPANLSAKADTTEVYGAIGWKFLTLKYSHAVSSHFIGWYGGLAGADTTKKTRGSGYLELNANYDLGDGWGLSGHVGRQNVKNYIAVGDTNASYTDWKIGVTKDAGFGVFGLAYSDTNAKGVCGPVAALNTNAYCWGSYSTAANASTNFRNASKGTVVLTFNKTF